MFDVPELLVCVMFQSPKIVQVAPPAITAADHNVHYVNLQTVSVNTIICRQCQDYHLQAVAVKIIICRQGSQDNHLQAVSVKTIICRQCQSRLSSAGSVSQYHHLQAVSVNVIICRQCKSISWSAGSQSILSYNSSKCIHFYERYIDW